MPDPVYDYPDPHPFGEKRVSLQRGSLKSISLLDRLLLTHPVWLQLSINSATALHILHREPPGTFLVRKASTSQKKMLCVRLTDESVPSFVGQFTIREQDSAFSLESSAIGFPDLCRLVAFYCVSRDVLPFTLELPEAISKATSHKQLESISHMGVEFWSSQLNFRGPRNGPPPVAPLQASCMVNTQASQEMPTLFQEFCHIHTRSPQELDCGSGRGALLFINPLFLQEEPSRCALYKRNQFKRSLKVRISTETSSPLSPPASPPPPPPLLAKGTRHKCNKGDPVITGQSKEIQGEQEDEQYRQPGVLLPRRTSSGVVHKGSPALSPTAEEDYQLPKSQLQGHVNTKGESKVMDVDEAEDKSEEDAVLLLEARRAPSLSELDSSSSLSSLEETEESPERPPLRRGISSPALPLLNNRPVSTLRKMSAVFLSFFAPEKRVSRLVEELSRERRSAFGSLVQDFLRQQRDELSPAPQSSVTLLQGLRLFMSQAKTFLLDCRELQPPIEILVPENEKDLALEKAMFRCVLKPLKSRLDTALHAIHTQDGSIQQMADSIRSAQQGSAECFGISVGVPDAGEMEGLRRKLELMQRAYSPVDKVVLLLQVCKGVYKAMQGHSGQDFGADEFLPALSYVIVQCNIPELILEVEYMMELLEPSWLSGESGYYLTSVYASLCLIQSKLQTLPPKGLTREVRESLKEWRQRRSKEAQNQDKTTQTFFVQVLFQDKDCSTMKTLQWKSGDSCESLAQLCASKFVVAQPEKYALYRWVGEKLQRLTPDSQLQDLHSPSGGTSSLTYQLCDLEDNNLHQMACDGVTN